MVCRPGPLLSPLPGVHPADTMPDELIPDTLNAHFRPLLEALGLAGAWLSPSGQASGGYRLDDFGAAVTLHGPAQRPPEGTLRALAGVVRDWEALRAARDPARTEEQQEEQQRLAREARRHLAFLEAVLEDVADGIVACDAEGNLTIFNRMSREMHGVGSEGLAPDTWAERYSLFEADGRTPLPLERIPLFRAWRGEAVREQEMVIAPRNLPRRTVLASGRALRDEQGQLFGAVVAMHDISDRKHTEERWRHAALHDGLTGLPNRALLYTRLEAAIQRHLRDGRQGYAVLFCDLDNFKTVNDAYGHDVGDRLLLETATRLQQTLRGSDTIARLGGDEFAVLLDNPGDATSVMRVAQRLQVALAQPFRVMGQPLHVSASLGVTLASSQYTRVEDALRDADTAMYRAKQAGKGRAALFDESMHAEVLERLTLERDLRRALEEGELTLHYQPIMDLTALRCVGFEALLRWTHPQRGPVPPARFIPLAEASGLIVPLGRWVLDEAGRQLTAWRAAHPGLSELTVSVNVSGRQLHRHAQPEEHFLNRPPAPGIELEVTESTLLDAPEAQAVLRALADRGVCLSLDDFGTGYASLSALERHPITTLKIDRSFVAALPDGVRQRGIVQGVAMLAQHLRLRVIAEGIETPEQLRTLRDLGCTHGQGFLFARPLPAGAALAFALNHVGKAGGG
ncbi:putative bifunctional diguanylate cyclase/phosphodiesterase [Deinococcus aluminii]